MQALLRALKARIATEERLGYSLIMVNVAFLVAVAVLLLCTEHGHSRLISALFGDWSSYII